MLILLLLAIAVSVAITISAVSITVTVAIAIAIWMIIWGEERWLDLVEDDAGNIGDVVIEFFQAVLDVVDVGVVLADDDESAVAHLTDEEGVSHHIERRCVKDDVIIVFFQVAISLRKRSPESSSAASSPELVP